MKTHDDTAETLLALACFHVRRPHPWGFIQGDSKRKAPTLQSANARRLQRDPLKAARWISAIIADHPMATIQISCERLFIRDQSCLLLQKVRCIAQSACDFCHTTSRWMIPSRFVYGEVKENKGWQIKRNDAKGCKYLELWPVPEEVSECSELA